MKKFLLFVILSIPIIGFTQNITNIRTQQDGEKILVFYNIENSTADQLFRVKIYCSMDDNDKILLRAVSGDVGDNIVGGKQQYRAVWNVLEDVDELYSAEFFIEAEVKVDGSTIDLNTSIRKTFTHVIAFNSGLLETPFGARYSLIYNNRAGIYGACRFGSSYTGIDINYYLNENQDGTEYVDSSDYSSTLSAYSVLGGVLYNITPKDKYSIFVFAGAGYGQWGRHTSEYKESFKYIDQNNVLRDETYLEKTDELDWGFELEVGAMLQINKFVVGGGIAYCVGFENQINGVATLGFAF